MSNRSVSIKFKRHAAKAVSPNFTFNFTLRL